MQYRQSPIECEHKYDYHKYESHHLQIKIIECHSKIDLKFYFFWSNFLGGGYFGINYENE